MSVTEFASLKLKAPYTIHSDPLPRLLETTRERQSVWASFPLYNFTDHANSTIFFIGGWKSVEAHQEWLKSDVNQELLAGFRPYIDRVLVRHLDIPFEPEKLNVRQLVYHTTPDVQQDRSDEEGIVWTASGRYLEDPDAGWHHLTTYSQPLESPGLGTGRTVMERVDGKVEQ